MASPPSSPDINPNPKKFSRGVSTFRLMEFDKETILNSWELVHGLYERSSELNDFVRFLYKFFEVNGKSNDLVNWALQLEVETTNIAGELCRGDTLATKLFHLHFFSDAGLKYLTNLIGPILTKIVKTDRSLEVEGKVSSSEAKQNVKFIMSLTEELLNALLPSVDQCPIPLREAYCTMKKCLDKKFQDEAMSLQIISALFSLRFLCPCLVQPAKYGLISRPDFDPMSVGARGLVIFSKLFQYLANRYEIESTKPYAEAVNKFNKEHAGKITEFIKELVDENSISKAKFALLNSSASEIPLMFNEQVKRLAEENLVNYLQAYHQRKELELELMTQNAQEQILDAYHSSRNPKNEKEWKQIFMAKKKNLSVHERRGEKDEDNRVVIKAVTQIPTDMATLYTILRYQPNLMKFDSRITNVELVEEHDELRTDWHVEMNASFPFVARDWILSVQSQYGDERSMLFAFPIVREDRPPVKKFVRGKNLLTGYIIDQDPDDESVVELTTLYVTDVKGKQLYNLSCNSVLMQQKQLQEYFLSFKKAPRKPRVKPAKQ